MADKDYTEELYGKIDSFEQAKLPSKNILDELEKSRDFSTVAADVTGLRKAGTPDDDIIKQIKLKSTPPIKGEGILATGSRLGRSFVSGLAEGVGMLGAVPSVFGEGETKAFGERLIRASEKAGKILGPQTEAPEGIVKKYIEPGFKSTGTSLSGMAPGIAIGALGGPVGMVAGAITGKGLLFGIKQYRDFNKQLEDEATRLGATPDEIKEIKIQAKPWALISAGSEVGGEWLSDIISARILGFTGSKVISTPIKSGLVAVAKNYAKKVGLSLPGEIGGELGTTAIEAEAEKRVGLPVGPLGEALKQTAGQTAVQTALQTFFFMPASRAADRSAYQRWLASQGVNVKTKEDAINELSKRRPDLAKIMQEVGAEVPAEGERPAPPPTPPKEPGAPILPQKPKIEEPLPMAPPKEETTREPVSEEGAMPVPAIPAQEPKEVTNYIDNLSGPEEAFARSHAQRLQRGNPETWGYFTPIGQKIEVAPERAEKINADIDGLYAGVPVAGEVAEVQTERQEALPALSPPAQSQAKELWQMTVEEFGKSDYYKKLRSKMRRIKQSPGSIQISIIKRAMEEGKPVPPEVLKDYQDLAPKPPIAEPGKEGGVVQLRHYTGAELPEGIPTKGDQFGLIWFTEGESYLTAPPKAKGKYGYMTLDIPANKILRIDENPELLDKYLESEFGKQGRSKEKEMAFAESLGYSAIKRGHDVAMRPETVKDFAPKPPIAEPGKAGKPSGEVLPALRDLRGHDIIPPMTRKTGAGEIPTKETPTPEGGKFQFPPMLIEKGLDKKPILTVYHGSSGNWPVSKFNLEMVGKSRATTEGWGAYYATDIRNAQKFGPNIQKLNLTKNDLGKFLDGNAKLSEQTPYVREAIKDLVNDISASSDATIIKNAVGWVKSKTDSFGNPYFTLDREIFNKVSSLQWKPKELIEYLNSIKDPIKKELYKKRILGKPDMTGDELYEFLENRHHGYSQSASEDLLRRGIPGKITSSRWDLHSVVDSPNLIIWDESLLAPSPAPPPGGGGEVFPALRQAPEKNVYFSGTEEDRVLLQSEFLRIGQMGAVTARDFFNALPDAELREMAEANRQSIPKDRNKLIDNMVHYSTRAAMNVRVFSMRAPRTEESMVIRRPAPGDSLSDYRRFINAYGLGTLLRLSGIKQSAKIADFMETSFGFGQGTEDPAYKTMRASLISQGLDSKALDKIEEIYTGISYDHRNAIRSAKNTADLLRVVARFSKDKDAVALAKAMLSSDEALGYLEAAPVTKFHNTIVREGIEPTTSSFYTPTSHETFLQMDDLLRTTGDYADYLLLHEPLHAATVRKMTESDRKKIKNWIKAIEASMSRSDVANLDAYRKDLKQGATAFGLTDYSEHVYYGLTDEYEFLGQAYSSPGFRNFLKGFVIDKGGKKVSLWQEFKDWVRSVLRDLGVTESKLNLTGEQFDSLLGRVLSLGGEIMQREVEARKYAQQPIQNPNHQVRVDTVAALGNSWQNSNLGHLVDHYLGKTPKGINVITTETHGPQFFHWFRNMESILSQTSFGRKIYEAARWFKHRTIATYNQWERTYRETTKDLNDDEKVVLLWVLDSNRPIPQANHKVLDAAQKVRTLLDGVWTYMRDNGLDVGYIQNYFPHVFNGAFWIKQKGQDVKMADSLGEALKMAKEAFTANGVPVDIEQDAMQMPIDGTPLSRKSFWNLNQALVDEIGKRFPIMQGITADDIASLLVNDKVARPLPGKRFFGNMLPRLINNPNFRRNIDEVIGMYLYGAARKVSQDEFKKTVQTNVEAMPPEDADLRRFVEQTYMPLVLAHPSRTENAIARSLSAFFPGLSGQDIRRISHKFNLIQYVWDMGVSFTSAVANASQFWINAQPIVGPVIATKAYAKAIHSFKDPQLMRELEEMGITEGVSSFSGVPLAHEVWKDVARKIRFKEGLSGFAEASLAGFNVVEMVNRFSAYWAGKAWADKQLKSGKSAEEVAKRIAPENSSLVELGRELDKRTALRSRVQKVRLKTIATREQFISQWGFELNDKTNFRAGRENLPHILSEAPMRFVSPYKSFILNQLKFMVDTVGIKGWKEHPLTALNFMASSFLLGGALANPATMIMVKALSALSLALGGDDLEKELKRKGLWRGMSGLFGFDIAGSVALQAPTLTGPEGGWELVGRFGRSTRDLFQYLLASETPEIYREKKLTRGIQPAMMQRVIDAMEILKTGQYRSPITMTPITLKDPSWDAIKRLFGVMPEKVLTEYDLESEQQKLKAKFSASSEDMRVRFASAKTPEEQQEIINRFVKEFNKSLDKFKNSKSEDQIMNGMTELLFWSSWINNDPALKKMVMRLSVSREITKLQGLPTYMRPSAAIEAQRRGLLGAQPNR